MKLLYLSEHHSCFNYGIKIDSGFTQYRLAAQESGQIDNSCCFCILFLLKGELSVNIGREHNIHLLEHNMLLIPKQQQTFCRHNTFNPIFFMLRYKQHIML